MLDFMVIALPRSGTTWTANWLTAYGNVCLHDPLYKLHYKDWDKASKYIPGVTEGRHRGWLAPGSGGGLIG